MKGLGGQSQPPPPSFPLPLHDVCNVEIWTWYSGNAFEQEWKLICTIRFSRVSVSESVQCPSTHIDGTIAGGDLSCKCQSGGTSKRRVNYLSSSLRYPSKIVELLYLFESIDMSLDIETPDLVNYQP